MPNPISDKLNYSIIFLILSLLILFGIVIWMTEETGWFGENDIPAVNNIIGDQQTPPSRAEVLGISGKESGNFLEVSFDPFKLKEGEEQKITVLLQNPQDITTFKAILKDGAGPQEKDFTLITEKDNTGSYQIVWQPKWLVLGASYPVEFKYQTKSGQENKMTLFWDAISF